MSHEATSFVTPDPLQLQFEGFAPEAFAALERLRARPHVEQYRSDKAALKRYVQAPFGVYRDDLVLNWVLPNRLPFETERNVFSRLLKNDFGAGGAHGHLWMAFYRPPRRRLTDVQLSHSVYPDGFVFGLYCGDYAKGLFRPALAAMQEDEGRALDLLNGLIRQGYTFTYAPTIRKSLDSPTFTEALAALPEDLRRAKGMWVRKRMPREEVLALGPRLVERAISAQAELWPLYRWWAGADGGVGAEPGR
ncbi:MAG: hypothetical protein R3362_03425 [Rhodothermales bacterium]|nr:hypothetical protein [Rhodothermales bacterium]